MSEDLTSREREILILLANGRTVAKAAKEMGIALQTAKNLTETAYKKLAAPNRYAAFLELGWLIPPEIRR